MLRTTVPEAAIDEHRDARCGENDVGFTALTQERSNINPISHAQGVQHRPDTKLRSCVLSPVRTHGSARVLG